MTTLPRREKIRLATADDFRAFYGKEPPGIWIGGTAERDGELVGFGAVIWSEQAEAWGVIDLKAKVSQIGLFRMVRRVMAALKEVGEPVLFCECDGSVRNADRLLLMLGFEPTTRDEQTIWRADLV